MIWRYGLSSRAPALHVQNPEFKPQSYQKKKKERENKRRCEKGEAQ
jgi:hypothetical protein